jgi:RNA recognition motif-containing protein
MSKRIYVGNLSFETTEADITNLFEQAGEVESVSIITDRNTGRSKGFGFVEMGNESATKAIAQLNGAELKGRSLTVNEARPREDRPQTGGNRNGGNRGGRGGYGSRY